MSSGRWMEGLRSLKPTISASKGSRPILLELRSSTWFITATVCTAIFTDLFLYAVVTPVFPFSLVARQGVHPDEVQHWLSVLLAIYGVGLVVGAPICGVLADRITYRKVPLLFGLLLVAGSTVMLCVARSLPLLIVGRVLQGLAASVIWVVGLALISDTVDQDEIAKALGYVGTAISLGTLIAPLLGGIVYQQAGYYAVYAMCFGVIALDVFLRLTMIEKKAAVRWLDIPADDNTATAGADLVTTVIEAEKPKHVSMVTESDPHKLKVPAILILLKSPRMLAAVWGTICVSSFMCGLDTTLTLFLNRTFGWNSLAAGVMFLAVLLPIFFGPVVGIFVDKYGARWISAVGFVLMIPFWVLLRLVDHNSIQQKVLLGTFLAFIGVGSALAIVGLTAEFSKICDDKERENPGMFGKNGAYAQSYGLFNVGWATGSIVGAFWAGGVYSTAGWATLGWSFALLAGVTAIPVLLFTDGWIGTRRKHIA